MNLIAVFLASDKHSLVIQRIAHTQIAEVEDENENSSFQDYHFFIHDGLLTFVSSTWAQQNIGNYIGVLEEGSDPEQLRKRADEFLLWELKNRFVARTIS